MQHFLNDYWLLVLIIANFAIRIIYILIRKKIPK